jgi:peptide/nickel transport system substrate-binding protein
VKDSSHYKNPAVDKLMQQAAAEVDHAKRIQMYAEIQKMILDDAPWIFVNSTLQVRAARKNVKGFQLNPTQMFFDMDQVSLQ